ncbi:MAG: alpha/beta fold hydrolase [Usitatibacter sp.]
MRALGGRIPHGRFGPPTLKRVGLVALKVLLLAAMAGYLSVVLLVWLAQDRMLFIPQPAPRTPSAPEGWRLDQVVFDTRDGTRVAGVLALPPMDARAPLVIYYGGNAEEVTTYAARASADYGKRAVLLVNYRGYGASRGRPGEAAMVADALELFDWAAKHPAIDAGRIALHGVSLGTGVAVQVAAARPVRCVVLTSPFASVRDVARERFTWLPVNLLLRHPFDSGARAPAVKTPLLVLVGEDDDLIAPHHSARLAALWGGPVERVGFPGFGHNGLALHPGYGTAIRSFLDRRQ